MKQPAGRERPGCGLEEDGVIELRILRLSCGAVRTPRFLAMASFVLALLATPLASEAQSAGRTPRIAVLGVTPTSEALAEAFKQGLGEFGYTEGRNVLIDYRDAEGDQSADRRGPRAGNLPIDAGP